MYPVRPRDAYGQRVDGAALDAFAQQLKAGVPTRSLPPEVAAQRDATVSWLLDEVAYLRDPSLPVGSWSGFDIRPELMGSWELASPFHTRLLDFLTETTQPTDLRELTSFSLPAGRSPSGDDAWVFVQFFGAEGVLTQQSLEVVSRRDGRLLLDYGFAQDAGQTTESPEVEAALAADPYGELHETVVSSTTEIGKVRDLILRPDELFVPNTTCATCHRLNELRFNFHSLSHFEDEDHTVSPRVEADVAYELAWTRSWMGGWE